MRNPDNLKDLDALADLLDTRFKGPFGTRFGLDGLLGLIPGLGDLITGAMGAYIVLKATWLGYPVSVIARMLLNFGFDNLFSAIPLFGNIFDFFFKSNTRNVSLMRAYELDPARTHRRSLFWVGSVLFAILAVIATAVAGSLVLVYKIFEYFTTTPPVW